MTNADFFFLAANVYCAASMSATAKDKTAPLILAALLTLGGFIFAFLGK